MKGLPAAPGAGRRPPPASVIRFAVSRRPRIAPAATVMPLTPGSSGSAGIAVVPSGLPSARTRPGVRRAPAAGRGGRFGASPEDCRSALPPVAVTSGPEPINIKHLTPCHPSL